MRLNKLSLKDKEIFTRYLSFGEHELSVYSFANIYIWRKLFSIEWVIIRGSLCIFFKDKIGCFLYLPPLCQKPEAGTLEEVFSLMDSCNKNTDISRIENIEEKDRSFYRSLGYDCAVKSYDYICRRKDLVDLRGDRFKSKRASCNYFTKKHSFKCRALGIRDKEACLELYSCWMKERREQNNDPLYQGMLEDSRITLKEALNNYRKLDLIGRVVLVDKKIKGFTLGFKLSCSSFCILYEITDLSIKGLAQFIFRQFARELKDYRYINIMDDLGLENLKKVKLSYHPVRFAPAYIVRRKKI